MALSAALQGVERLALDTAPLIYLLERHATSFVLVEPVFAAIDDGSLRGIVSSLVLVETLVGPLQSGNAALASQYRRALTQTPNLELVSMDAAVAELAATIRAQHRFKTPNAIHLATAVLAKADAFLTNDRALRAFTGVRVVTVSEL